MRIKCQHGYFKFFETKVGQVSDFVSRYDLDLVAKDDYFTFTTLAQAADYSLAGSLYLGVTAVETFAGQPWEVMEANGLIYNFDRGLVQSILTVTTVTPIYNTGNRYVSPGLILPGSLIAGGSRIRDYTAWFSRDTLKFSYSEVAFVE